MKLRIGFAGLGVMGVSHVNSIRKLCGDQAEVAAVCARNEKNLRRALEIAPHARAYGDETELIHSPLDAVFISTPNFTHLPLALGTLKAGRHLFLEKPCGITLEECEQLVRASEKTDRVVMVGHEFRYSPYFQRIKQLVDAGDIGQPRMAWCREFRHPFQKKSQDWIQDDRRSGGCLVDKNCHQFDLMNWWVGARPRRVAAFGGCAVNRVIEGPHQVHDHATVSFEYDNHARGTLHLCLFGRDFPDEDLELGVLGDAGVLQTRLSELQILQWRRGVKQKEPLIHQVSAKRGEGWGSHLGFDEMHVEFVNCIREQRQPLTTVSACVDGTRLAIAAEASIKAAKILGLE